MLWRAVQRLEAIRADPPIPLPRPHVRSWTPWPTLPPSGRGCTGHRGRGRRVPTRLSYFLEKSRLSSSPSISLPVSLCLSPSSQPPFLVPSVMPFSLSASPPHTSSAVFQRLWRLWPRREPIATGQRVFRGFYIDMGRIFMTSSVLCTFCSREILKTNQ